MSGTIKRIVLGLGTAAMAVTLAVGAYAAGQNTSPAAGQGPGAGRFGGPGGPFGRGGRGGPGGPGGFMGPGVLGPMMLHRLDLSSDQRDRVKQIVESHRDEQQAIRQRAMAAHDALQTAVTAPVFDEGVIRAKAADVAAVEADQVVASARIFAEAYQILTSEQQTKLKAMQAEMHQRREQMRANRQR
jgi:Spy/CpxP family protein refolding chaperone